MQDFVISESTAKELFGEIDPIGKEIKIGKPGEEKFFTVTALAKDSPKNSSIRFDGVVRIETLDDYATKNNNWGDNASNVFVKISKNSNPNIVENKFVPFVEEHYSDQLADLKLAHPQIENTRELFNLNLTQIDEIHFSGARSIPKTLVYAIMALGAFILLIACFNFVNLNIAQSFKRSRELGVRKTLGAFKGQLFLQLWGEAFLLYFIGFVLGIILAYQLLPIFNGQFDLGIQISQLFHPEFLAILFCIFLVVTLIAGGYPALKMANFGLVDILKGKVSTKKPGMLRNTMLISQFTISSLLICVSWVAGQQLDYLREKPIGFERNQVISIPVGFQEDGRVVLARLRNELANDPSILSVTGSSGNLGRGRDRITFRTTGDFAYKQNKISADKLLADYDFLKTMQIPIVKGRDFSPEFATDTVNAVVVTESFVKAMGESDPIGKYLGGENNTSGDQIIGVVSDFNLHSPSEKTLPIAIHLSSKEAINYIFLKVRSDDPAAIMAGISSVWSKTTSNDAFNGSFLNENLQAWYEGESMMTQIFGIASGIAIFLSCLGLFAISLLVIEMRTKEIGIRKVMGASVNNVVLKILFYFLKLVLIALLIALPFGWFIMQNWIENYEYRIALAPVTFIGIGLLVIVFALITVSFHTIKAATTNPVKSLRTE
jgi:ABC-type antimicrobial peptide transport system permease subunit